MTTKLRQTNLAEKNDASAAMVRLVTELTCRLDDAGMLASPEQTQIDNVVNEFLRLCPVAVRLEVVQG